MIRIIPPILVSILTLMPLLAALMSTSDLTVSAWFGWYGAGLLSLSLVLMVREPVISSWFGGLERMYRWHHVLGTLGYIAVLFHVISMAVPYWPGDLVHAWKAVKATAQDWGGILGWVALLALMVGLAGTFAMRLRYSLWRQLHMMLALAVVVGFVHIFAIRDLSVGFFLAIVPAMLAIGWRMLRVDLGKSARPYEVSSVAYPAQDIVEVILRPLARPIPVSPGQFVMGAFFEGPRYRGCGEFHPFTVSNINDDGTIALTIKAIGDCTRHIQTLEAGVATRIQGPYGSFFGERSQDPELWVAGGIGITPFISSLRAGSVEQPVMLIYAYRSAIDTAYLGELASLAQRQPLLEYHALSMQKDIGQIDHLLDQIHEIKTRQAYLCGPLPMLNKVMSSLRKRGMPQANIHSEDYDLR